VEVHVLRDAVIDELKRVLGEHAEGLDFDRFLAAPPKPEMGDLAFGCFGLAKVLRKSPAAIAAELAPQVQTGGTIASADAAGPYLNFRGDSGAMLTHLAQQVATGSALSPEPGPRVMVEFSQPNTHKFFHVGHLRNVAIGDALVRILRADGHDVVAANYYGDFGIDVAKCLWWLQTHPELEAPDVDRTTFLGKAYTDANDQLDKGVVGEEQASANFAEVREVLHGLETQDPAVWPLYQQTRQWCLDEFAATYDWLNVHFDVDFFESEVEGPANAIVDHFLEEGVFTLSDGAVVCDLTPDMDVPALVRKRDGTSLYMTWDLALAKAKFDDWGVEKSLYVVGSEQKFHFKQLFLTLERMGYERAKDCRHVAYELVQLPDGKMSSRKGTAIPLHTLQHAVADAIRERLTQANARVPEEDIDETVRRLSVACLKYGMLSVGVNKRVIFSLDEWTRFEGDTGAYLLYMVARMRSILRNAGETVDLTASVGGSTFGEAVEERALLNQLLGFEDVVERAARELDPSFVASWCYDCARDVSRFWSACPVLQEESEALRRDRLRLVATAERVMTEGLGLIGIEPVDAM
jgi:arginyl-tRNA synthetase